MQHAPLASWMTSYWCGCSWRSLPVEPNVLEAIAAEDGVHHHRQPLDRGRPARTGTGIEDHWPAGILGELALDFPHQLVALLGVGFARLLLGHAVDLGTAVAVPVQARAAAIEQVEHRIGIDPPAGRQV